MFSPLQHYGQQFDRAQQVNELLVAQPMCRATNPDRSVLEVGVRLQDGTLTSLRITLPPGFPTERPSLEITSPVRHPWVDSRGHLSFPLLNRWGEANVRLAAVVTDAFKGLGGQPAVAPTKPSHLAGSNGGVQQPLGSPARPQQAAPPPPGVQQGAGGSSAAAAAAGLAGRLGRISSDDSGPLPTAGSSGGGAAASAAAAGGRRQGSPVRNRVMPIPSSFAEVQRMSDAELAEALAEEGAYRRLVNQLGRSLNLWQVVEQLKGETRELAATNLARAEEQADIRNQMAIIRSSEYAPAKAGFDAKWARQQAVLQKLSPEVLMRRLQESVRVAEAEGDQLQQQLTAGEIGVEAFVERYTRAQATYHQRDLKLQAAQQTLPPLGG